MRISHPALSLGALAAALVFIPAIASAQDAPPVTSGDTPALPQDERIARLEPELDTLKRQRDLAAQGGVRPTVHG